MEYNCSTSRAEADSFASSAPIVEQAEPAKETSAPVSSKAVVDISINLAKGAWFDEAVDFRDPEGDAITNEILALIAAAEDRQRKRRPVDARNHYTVVRKILANGFRCLHHRNPPLVAYWRRADSYRGKPAWLSGKAMSRTVDALERLALLSTSLGELGTASTYNVTEVLRCIAERHGITNSSLTFRLPKARLVRLRSSPPERKLIEFEATDQTRHWTALLEAYNGFLAKQDIGIALSIQEELEWAERWNGRDGETIRFKPELIRTDLYRQFNNGSFDEGGRLYGGWWINVPSVLRKRITINGQPTVELDFSGCAIRMLYQARGDDYRNDPYQLEAIEKYERERRLSPGHFRPGIKAIMQALINDCSDGKPEQIPLPNGLSFRPGFKRVEVRQMIEDKHAAIADAFGTGAGLQLQRWDSDLALAIITASRERGIVALPIHDSFIATAENRENLFNQMQISYKEMFGYLPIINYH